MKVPYMKIVRDRVKGTVYLSQKQYYKRVLNKFSIDESAKLVTMLLEAHFKLNLNCLQEW